jgi:acetylornithine deacetylase
MQLPGTIEMLRTLVSEPSVSCTSSALDQSNINVINHLATWLDGLGFLVEVIPLPSKQGKANLIATLGSGDGGLVLSGHTDTVPCHEEHWSQDPFKLTENDNRFYGLGTCDMKGFFPLALDAASKFTDAKLGHPLTIVATSDEESSMAGARYLAEIGNPKARAAIIGEPTGLMPVCAHKGIMMLSISLKGRSGHSSNPKLGKNALDAMHYVIGELIRFRSELAISFQNPAFEVPTPTLNLGCLAGGDNPNRICETAELQIDLRLIPGMDYETTYSELKTRLCQIAETHGVLIDMSPFYPPIPPYETASNGELVGVLETLSRKRAGAVAFGTEAPFLQSLGMETVIFGPGSIDQAHQTDEYLDAGSITPATEILIEVIKHYCLRAV